MLKINHALLVSKRQTTTSHFMIRGSYTEMCTISYCQTCFLKAKLLQCPAQRDYNAGRKNDVPMIQSADTTGLPDSEAAEFNAV